MLALTGPPLSPPTAAVPDWPLPHHRPEEDVLLLLPEAQTQGHQLLPGGRGRRPAALASPGHDPGNLWLLQPLQVRTGPGPRDQHSRASEQLSSGSSGCGQRVGSAYGSRTLSRERRETQKGWKQGGTWWTLRAGGAGTPTSKHGAPACARRPTRHQQAAQGLRKPSSQTARDGDAHPRSPHTRQAGSQFPFILASPPPTIGLSSCR